MEIDRPTSSTANGNGLPGYCAVLDDVALLLETARRASARAVNSLMVATYWEVGRRIVEFEQGGAERAVYGEKLLQRLAKDLTQRFGRGFGPVNLAQMRKFFLEFEIFQTLSEKLPGEHSATEAAIRQTVSVELPGEHFDFDVAIRHALTEDASSRVGLSTLKELAARFPLPWSHYVRLLAVRNPEGRKFYEAEALRGGWTVLQLERQIGSQFYEGTLPSRKKAITLRKGLGIGMGQDPYRCCRIPPITYDFVCWSASSSVSRICASTAAIC